MVVENRPTPDDRGADALALELPNVLVPNTDGFGCRDGGDCWPKAKGVCAWTPPLKNEPKPVAVSAATPAPVVGKALGELDDVEEPNVVDPKPRGAGTAAAPNSPGPFVAPTLVVLLQVPKGFEPNVLLLGVAAGVTIPAAVAVAAAAPKSDLGAEAAGDVVDDPAPKKRVGFATAAGCENESAVDEAGKPPPPNSVAADAGADAAIGG